MLLFNPAVRAMRPWLLTLTLLRSILHGMPAALAQPGPGIKALHFPPLSANDQAAITRAVGLARQEDLCQMSVRLKVTHASATDIVARLQAQLPQHALIEVRQSSPARFSLNLPNATLRQVLQAVADLSDCNFYILTDRLLLAREEQLTPQERAEVAEHANVRSSAPEAYFHNQGQKLVAHIIVAQLAAVQGQIAPHSIAGGRPTVFEGETIINFGQLPPDLQQTVQQWFNSFMNPKGASPQRLAPDTIIAFASAAQGQNIELDIRGGLSSGQRLGAGYGYRGDVTSGR